MNTAETIELLLYKIALSERNHTQTVSNVLKVVNNQVKKGIDKYGGTLDDKNLNNEELINHAIEECVDCAFYLTKIFNNINDCRDNAKNSPYNNNLVNNMVLVDEQINRILKTCLTLDQFKNSSYFKN